MQQQGLLKQLVTVGAGGSVSPDGIANDQTGELNGPNFLQPYTIVKYLPRDLEIC